MSKVKNPKSGDFEIIKKILNYCKEEMYFSGKCDPSNGKEAMDCCRWRHNAFKEICDLIQNEKANSQKEKLYGDN